MSTSTARVGIIGGGLMGREAAAAFGRWLALEDLTVRPELVAVCDTDTERRNWFRRVPTVKVLTEDYRTMLETDLDVVYVAVPHDLHEKIYVDVLEAGADLLGEKPFGIDLQASEAIVTAQQRTGRFVRCSSEMPFFPGAQFAIDFIRSGRCGQMLEGRSAFLHSSDVSRSKAINWKRQVRHCGRIGVMGDLGMHILHAPLRMGWTPAGVSAVLQDIVHERPDGRGNMVACDTIDNAALIANIDHPDGAFPLSLEMKRIAPGESNTWVLEAVGMDGGVRFSTRNPQVVEVFESGPDGSQVWRQEQPGHRSVFPTITGGIFEFGFGDAILQMWAAFFAERSGDLGERFGCATPTEAMLSHRVFAAALESNAESRRVST